MCVCVCRRASSWGIISVPTLVCYIIHTRDLELDCFTNIPFASSFRNTNFRNRTKMRTFRIVCERIIYRARACVYLAITFLRLRVEHARQRVDQDLHGFEFRHSVRRQRSRRYETEQKRCSEFRHVVPELFRQVWTSQSRGVPDQ